MALDNVLYALEKSMINTLDKIKEISYGSESYKLWETLGFISENVKGELELLNILKENIKESQEESMED